MLWFFKRYPIALWPLYFAFFIGLLAIFARPIELLFRFDQTAILNGEIWRIFTAHWVHLGWSHALLNMGGLLLLAWLQPSGRFIHWLLFYGFSSVFISGYWLISEHNAYYVGASGVLHGLLIVGAFYSLWLDKWRKGMFILAIILKLIWEQSPYYANESLVQLIGANVAVDAHFLGGVSGLIILVIFQAKKAYLLRQSTEQHLH